MTRRAPLLPLVNIMSERHIAAEIEELEDYEAPGEPARGFGWGWLVFALLAVGAVGYIMFDGSASETYFYEVDQAVARGERIVDKTIRIKGNVEAGSIVGQDGELGRTFRLAAKGKSMTVIYEKALPDTFQEGQEVVAQGIIRDDLTMLAEEVVVKCPSRYEGEAPTAMNGQRPVEQTPELPTVQ